MKVLVTGANGQVGTELIQSSLADELNIEIIACGRSELDITDINSVEQVVGKYKPDAIINAAAYTAVDKAEDDVETAYAVNEKGPANLAVTCNKLDIPLIHLSTDYVFDGTKEGAYIESDTPNPQGIYGKSKLAGELAISQQHSMHYIIRVAWVFGEYGNNFVKTMLKLADRDALSVVNDQLGSPTWAKDIADVCLLLAVKTVNAPVAFGTYHYCGDVKTSWFNFAQTIFDTALISENISSKPEVSPIPTTDYPTPATRPLNSTLSCEKIHKALAITSSDWKAGLKHVLKEWK